MSSGVLVVTDVSDSASSESVLGEALLSGSDCEMVEPQSFSLSQKRQAFFVGSQGDMNYDATPVKAPLASRRKITTPQQNPQPSIEAVQLQMEVEDQEFANEGEYQWAVRGGVVVARTVSIPTLHRDRESQLICVITVSRCKTPSQRTSS